MINNNSPEIYNSDSTTLKDLVLKFRELINYVYSFKLKILFIAFIFGLLGFAFAWFSRPTYTAESTFVLEDGGTGGSLNQYAGVASMMGIDLNLGGGNGLFSGDNILELYRSKSMIIKTLLTETKAFGPSQLLVDRYVLSNGLREQWDKEPDLKGIKFGYSRGLKSDSLLGEIANDINKKYLKILKPDKTLSVIKVSMKSEDQLFAKEFNDQIVKNVNDFYIRTRTKKAADNLQILQHQTDSVRRQLNSAISGVASSVDYNPNANAARQVLRVPSQRRQVDVESNRAILVELVKTLEMSKVSLRKETPLIQVIDKPILPLDRTKFGKVKGVIFGGFVGGILAIFYYLMRKIIKDILN